MLAALPLSLLISALALSLPASARPGANSSSRARSPLSRRSLPAELVDASSPAALQRAFALPVPATPGREMDPLSDDAPNFGAPCSFDPERAFLTCGDWLDHSTGVDYGLFCSPAGVCAGEGAVCGASEGCGQGLECNLSRHRCAPKGSFGRSRGELLLEGRRKAAGGACPVESEVCRSGGGWECVYTQRDDQECGACLGSGGVDCSAIEGALATSCRRGSCVVHSCAGGLVPTEDGKGCQDDML